MLAKNGRILKLATETFCLILMQSEKFISSYDAIESGIRDSRRSRFANASLYSASVAARLFHQILPGNGCKTRHRL
jgi:hypothetical protein